jgi:hypothetical protein
LTDFYTYFEIRARVTDRVGAVSPEAALADLPNAFRLLDRLRAPRGSFPHVVSVAVEPIDLIPHFQAEEFAKHAFMTTAPAPFTPPWVRPPDRPTGHQFLWRVELDLLVRCAHIVSAPSRALAAARNERMLRVIADTGLTAIDPCDTAFAKIEPVTATPWVPDAFASLHAKAAR